MQIVFKRRLTNEILTTYLPTVLLLLIVFSTTKFKPFFFEAALMVNLTVMLVITTLFISVMEKLPSTSYIRMVDIWLIFGQLIPFAEVVLITFQETYRNDEVQKVNHHGHARELTNKNDAPEVTPTYQSFFANDEASLNVRYKTYVQVGRFFSNI